jgi:hypothetical protein
MIYDEDLNEFFYESTIRTKENKLKDLLGSFFEEVVHQIYRKGDVNELENALEEMGYYLDVSIPSGNPILQKNQVIEIEKI